MIITTCTEQLYWKIDSLKTPIFVKHLSIVKNDLFHRFFQGS